jgi:hypothetical protein
MAADQNEHAPALDAAAASRLLARRDVAPPVSVIAKDRQRPAPEVASPLEVARDRRQLGQPGASRLTCERWEKPRSKRV